MRELKQMLGAAVVAVSVPVGAAQASVVGYWTFDDYAVGDSLASDNIVRDESGNGRHMRAILNPGTTILGATGTTAAYLDGDGERFEFLPGFNAFTNSGLTASSSDLVFSSTNPGGSDSFTIEAIVTLPHNDPSAGGVGAEGAVLGKGQFAANSGNDQIFINAVNNGGSHPNTVEAFIGDGASPLGTTRVSNINEQNISNDWHHIAAVRDRSADSWSLFLDGVLVSQFVGSAANGDLDNLVGNFVVGARDATGTNPFRGGVDMVRISDTALDSSEFLLIPEPSVGALFLLGVACMASRKWRAE